MAAARPVANPVGQAALGLVVMTLGLVFLSGVAAANRAPVRVVYGVLAVGAAGLLARVGRAGVLLSGDGVVVRGWVRTRTIRRDQIAEVVVVDSGNVTGSGLCVGFRLRDGSLVRALATASYSRRKVTGYQAAIASG